MLLSYPETFVFCFLDRTIFVNSCMSGDHTFIRRI